MKYIIFIILLILLIITYYLSKKIMSLNNIYNRVVDKHTALFSLIKKKTEAVIQNNDDEKVIQELNRINMIADLEKRITQILDYPDEYLNDEIIIALEAYNEEVERWESIQNKDKRLSKMLGYIKYNGYRVKK